MIRQATAEDASRIAEILIFDKRVHYRCIFHNDEVSFGEMQVLPLALEFQDNAKALEGIYVYDDGFVKGLIDLSDARNGQITHLYVDWFFEGAGIGRKLMEFAIEKIRSYGAPDAWLWVLEKNENARAFYEKRGFTDTGEKVLEEGTTEYLLKYARPLQDN